MSTAGSPLAVASVAVLPDQAAFDKAMARLMAKAGKQFTALQKLAKPIKLSVDIPSSAIASVKAFRAKLSTPIRIPVSANISVISRAKVAAMRAWWGRTITIPVNVAISSSAYSKIAALRASITGGKAGITVGVRIASGASAKVAAFRASISKPIAVKVTLDASGVLSKWAGIKSKLKAPVKVTLIAGAAKSIFSISSGFKAASKSKDAFAANVAAKFPKIIASIKAAAAAASSLKFGGGGFRMPRFGGGFGGGGLGMGLGAGLGVYAIAYRMKSGIMIGAQFERKMLEVKGVLELTGEEGAKTFADLNKSVMEMSKNSMGFGPGSIAGTFKELAEKGMNPKQIKAATPEIADLAGVNNLDLQKTGDIVTGVMNAFKVDFANTGHVIDILQGAANKSSSDIEYLGESMRHASGFASLMGMTIQDTAAMVGAMSQSGIRAADTGYALSTMFQRLINPTTRGTKSLKAINDIFMVTGRNQRDFFQGNTIRKGKVMDFLGVVEEYRKRVSSERFAATFSKIVGAKGGKLLQAFAFKNMETGKVGLGEVKKMSDDITKNDIRGPGKKGIVKSMRETVETGLDVQIQKMLAAVERLQVSLTIGVKRELIQIVGWITKAVEWLTELNNKNDGIVGKTLVWVAAVAAAGLAFVGVVTVVGSLISSVVTVAKALWLVVGSAKYLAVIGLGPIGAIMIALAAAAWYFKDEFVLAISEVIYKLTEFRVYAVTVAEQIANAFDGMWQGSIDAIARMMAFAAHPLDPVAREEHIKTLIEDQERVGGMRKTARKGYWATEKGKAEAARDKERGVRDGVNKAYQEKKAKENDEKAAKNKEFEDAAKFNPGKLTGGGLPNSETGNAGKDDKPDIVGIAELHNKIQRDALDNKDDEIANNTGRAADELEELNNKFVPPGDGAPPQGAPLQGAGDAQPPEKKFGFNQRQRETDTMLAGTDDDMARQLAASMRPAQIGKPDSELLARDAAARAAADAPNHRPAQIGKPDPKLFPKPEELPHLQATSEPDVVEPLGKVASKIRTKSESDEYRNAMLAKQKEKREYEKVRRRLGDYGPLEKAKQEEEDRREERNEKARVGSKMMQGKRVVENEHGETISTGESERTLGREMVQAAGEEQRAEDDAKKPKYWRQGKVNRGNSFMAQAQREDGTALDDRTPFERKMAVLSASIAEKDRLHKEAVGRGEAMRGMQNDGGPDSVVSDQKVKSPQQAFGVKSGFVANPVGGPAAKVAANDPKSVAEQTYRKAIADGLPEDEATKLAEAAGEKREKQQAEEQQRRTDKMSPEQLAAANERRKINMKDKYKPLARSGDNVVAGDEGFVGPTAKQAGKKPLTPYQQQAAYLKMMASERKAQLDSIKEAERTEKEKKQAKRNGGKGGEAPRAPGVGANVAAVQGGVRDQEAQKQLDSLVDLQTESNRINMQVVEAVKQLELGYS